MAVLFALFLLTRADGLATTKTDGLSADQESVTRKTYRRGTKVAPNGRVDVGRKATPTEAPDFTDLHETSMLEQRIDVLRQLVHLERKAQTGATELELERLSDLRIEVYGTEDPQPWTPMTPLWNNPHTVAAQPFESFDALSRKADPLQVSLPSFLEGAASASAEVSATARMMVPRETIIWVCLGLCMALFAGFVAYYFWRKYFRGKRRGMNIEDDEFDSHSESDEYGYADTEEHDKNVPRPEFVGEWLRTSDGCTIIVREHGETFEKSTDGSTEELKMKGTQYKDWKAKKIVLTWAKGKETTTWERRYDSHED